MKETMKKFWDSWAGSYVLAFILLFAGTALGEIPIDILEQSTLNASLIWQTASGYISFIGIWIVMLIYYARSKRDHWLLPLVGRGAKGNTPLMLLAGLLIGFAMNGVCIFAAVRHGDFTLQAGQYSMPAILGIFLCIFIQSSAEELVCRNFLYQKLVRQCGSPLAAVLGNALFFAVLHLFNPGITVLSVVNLMLCGVCLSMLVWATDSLWLVFGIHTMWNFTQNIIFGLPNSGRMVPYTICSITGIPQSSFAYDAVFGVEGGLLSCLVYVIVAAAALLIAQRQGKKLL